MSRSHYKTREQRSCKTEGCLKQVMQKGFHTSGNPKYGVYCKSCYTNHRRRPWRLNVGQICERCGFVPENVCQLDVDHIDGDNSNNNLINLQTLCANCHRLKTWQNRDWETK